MKWMKKLKGQRVLADELNAERGDDYLTLISVHISLDMLDRLIAIADKAENLYQWTDYDFCDAVGAGADHQCPICFGTDANSLNVIEHNKTCPYSDDWVNE
jgi:hypothetical protein